MISTKVLRSGRILGRFRKMLPLLFFVVLVAALFCTTPFSLWRSGVVLTTVSLLVALCGFAVRWSASKCDSRNPMEMAACGGIYSMVRFPYFLADLLLVYAVSIYAGMAWFLFFIVPVSYMVVERIIASEEHRLATRYGEEYLHYCRETNALVPPLFSWRRTKSRVSFLQLLSRQRMAFCVTIGAFTVVDIVKNLRIDFTFRINFLWLGLFCGAVVLYSLPLEKRKH